MKRPRLKPSPAVPFEESSETVRVRILTNGAWATAMALTTPFNRRRNMNDSEKRLKFYTRQCGSRVPLAREHSCQRAPAGNMLWAPNGTVQVYCDNCLHYSLGDLEADASEAV